MKRLLLRLLIALVVLLGLFAAAFYLVYGGAQHEGPGQIRGVALPAQVVDSRARRQRAAVAALPREGRPRKQILFGDLHVHTTYSMDAFFRSLPLLGGEGAHPPADACDFARYCSGLDFFSFNDHAEAMTPAHWRETKQTVRECNARAGDRKNPDLVVFAGWEWTQVGTTVDEHYGHKNIIFRDEAEQALPKRTIAAPGFARQGLRGGGGSLLGALAVPLLDFSRRQRYLDFARMRREAASVPDCERGVDVRDLPERCHEEASTPAELFEKLSQWGFEHLVIPHGTTWGIYTPPGYEYEKQIARAQNSPAQRLIEVYSGHGNSEEYRSFRASKRGDGRQLVCPAPTADYEPCCWRAGEIIRKRCAGASREECERRVEEARKNYLRGGLAGHHAVPGATVDDWGTCGQCEDCFLPSFSYRPGGSAQYILAKGDFTEPDEPAYAPMGFIASSDNHSARPGTGYKEYARRKMTEATGPESAEWRERLGGRLVRPPTPESERVEVAVLLERGAPAFAIPDFERQASFFLTGGLVAVHATGRSRAAIWDALSRREVYGTSGPRILLWFDLVGDDGPIPMGADVRMGRTPRFVVRAVGAFEQAPGCPDWSGRGLSTERLERLCAGECYNPTDERRRITRIELVRIRPQRSPTEPIEDLVDDVWKRLPCPAGSGACQVSVEDPSFVEEARDSLYYARAIQEPTPAVNGGGLRCKRREAGRCVDVEPCYGDYRTPASDDCLQPVEERAWSSPIFVRFDPELVQDE